jgi:mono/diheme cytochrome c family protein
VDDEHKKRYLERYQTAKQHGGKFFPDIVYKDMIVSFGLFLLLLGLATFVGVKPEPPADPSDANYVPRPEWYFLFLFQLLKYFPGKIEWVGTTVVPILAVLALLLLPFYDRSPFRHWRKRKLGLSIMSLGVIAIVVLTLLAVVSTPAQEEFSSSFSVIDQIVAGQDLYSIECVECHGSEGEGGEITTVEGLEGVVVAPMNAPDFIYTRTDRTIFNVIDYGQQDLGMPPFGMAYGGELQRADIDAIVTFIRYTWDDRVEVPEEEIPGGVPPLGPEEIPVYTVHIEPIIRRTCLSCHRPGKKNGEYLMRDYNEVLNSGDNAPNFIAGDLTSNTIRGMPETPEDLPTPTPTVAEATEVETPGTPEEADTPAPAEETPTP